MSLLHYAVWPWKPDRLEHIEPRGHSFEVTHKPYGEDRATRYRMRLHRLPWSLALDGCLYVYAITQGQAEKAACRCVVAFECDGAPSR